MIMFIDDPSKLWLGIGETLWYLQTLEFALGHYLVLTQVVPGDKDEAYRQLEKSFKATLGRLVVKLKESVSVNPEIEGRLEHLTEERNWLAHRIYRLHHTDIDDIQRFTELLGRISILGNEAINLAKEFGSLCMQWCLAKGVKEEDINMEIDRRLQERWNT
jgi:hypothetical protein